MAHQEKHQHNEAENALARLKQGNARFAAGKSTFPRLDAARRAETFTEGQRPFAAVLSCSDSRTPVELVFDQGVGDLFVVRVAGNVCGVHETASIEFSIQTLGTPLLVVMGHRDCGAVAAVVADVELDGSLPALVEHIKPAVRRAEAIGQSGDVLLDTAIQENVRQSIENLFARSQAVVESAKNGDLKIVGAVYDVESGRVQWLGER